MTKSLSAGILCLGCVALAANADAQNVFVTNFGTPSRPGTTVAGFSTTSGAPVATFSGGDSQSSIRFPIGIAADSTGSLFVTSINPGTAVSSILRIGTDGSIRTAVYGPPPNDSTTLYNPKGIAFGSSGQLFVNNGGPGANPVGNSFTGVANVATGAYSNVYGGANSSLSAPYAIAYAGGQYLYASNDDNSITRFDTTSSNTAGVQLTLTPSPGTQNGIFTLNGLALGPDGALYASDGSTGSILRISAPSTNASTLSLFTGGLSGPQGIAFEPGTNNLFVASDDNTIRRIIPAGTVATGYTAGVVDPLYLVQEAANSGPTFLAFSPIPEPSTYALFGVAGVTALTLGLRRQRVTLRA